MIAVFYRAFLVASCVALSQACVDTTPLDFVEPSPDGGADAGPVDAAASAACAACVTGEDSPCRDEYVACEGSEKCSQMVNCAIEVGCFSLGAQEKRIACATPCLTAAGVLAGADPAIALILAVNVCTLNACTIACGIAAP